MQTQLKRIVLSAAILVRGVAEGPGAVHRGAGTVLESEQPSGVRIAVR